MIADTLYRDYFVLCLSRIDGLHPKLWGSIASALQRHVSGMEEACPGMFDNLVYRSSLPAETVRRVLAVFDGVSMWERPGDPPMCEWNWEEQG